MERYYSDDEENEHLFQSEGQESTPPPDGEEAVAMIDQQGIIDVMHIDLAQVELNQKLLAQAVDIARWHWGWCFKDSHKKLDEIELIYRRLLDMAIDQEKS